MEQSNWRLKISGIIIITFACCLLLLTQVYYQPMKTYEVSDQSYDSSEQSNSTIMSNITLSGLYPASTYTIYIRSVNAAGEGNSSIPVSVVLTPTGE